VNRQKTSYLRYFADNESQCGDSEVSSSGIDGQLERRSGPPSAPYAGGAVVVDEVAVCCGVLLQPNQIMIEH